MIPAPSAASSATPGTPCGGQRGRREVARYRKFYQEACRKLQAEDFLERQRAWTHPDFSTTYSDIHGRPGFEPALERQLREGAALAPLQPLDASEPVLSLWYCRQRAGCAAGAKGAGLPRVSPAHAAPRPFHRTSAFTTPTHLSLHESPVQQPRPPPRLTLLDRLDDQGWRPRGAWAWGEADPGAAPLRYPLADVFADVGKKRWCDRRDDDDAVAATAEGESPRASLPLA